MKNQALFSTPLATTISISPSDLINACFYQEVYFRLLDCYCRYGCNIYHTSEWSSLSVLNVSTISLKNLSSWLIFLLYSKQYDKVIRNMLNAKLKKGNRNQSIILNQITLINVYKSKLELALWINFFPTFTV